MTRGCGRREGNLCVAVPGSVSSSIAANDDQRDEGRAHVRPTVPFLSLLSRPDLHSVVCTTNSCFQSYNKQTTTKEQRNVHTLGTNSTSTANQRPIADLAVVPSRASPENGGHPVLSQLVALASVVRRCTTEGDTRWVQRSRCEAENPTCQRVKRWSIILGKDASQIGGATGTFFELVPVARPLTVTRRDENGRVSTPAKQTSIPGRELMALELETLGVGSGDSSCPARSKGTRFSATCGLERCGFDGDLEGSGRGRGEGKRETKQNDEQSGCSRE